MSDLLRRIVTFFDEDDTAASFVAEDGEGGFIGAAYRMAREIDRLRALSAHTAEKGEAEPKTLAWIAVSDIAILANAERVSGLFQMSKTRAGDPHKVCIVPVFLAPPPPAPRDDLVAEVERLRAALREIAAHPVRNIVRGRPDHGLPGHRPCQEVAEEALSEGRTDA